MWIIEVCDEVIKLIFAMSPEEKYIVNVTPPSREIVEQLLGLFVQTYMYP